MAQNTYPCRSATTTAARIVRSRPQFPRASPLLHPPRHPHHLSLRGVPLSSPARKKRRRNASLYYTYFGPSGIPRSRPRLKFRPARIESISEIRARMHRRRHRRDRLDSSGKEGDRVESSLGTEGWLSTVPFEPASIINPDRIENFTHTERELDCNLVFDRIRDFRAPMFFFVAFDEPFSPIRRPRRWWGSGEKEGRRRRRNNGVDHRAIPTHHNSCSTVISAEPLGFPLFFHPPPPSHRRSKSPGFIIAFLSSFSSNFLKDFSFQLLSILYQYRYTRRAFRLKCILDASQFGKRERTLGFDENFPRRLPFEIASECTKFPPWHRSNYKIRATVQISPSQSDSHHPLPLPPPSRNWNVAYVLSIATALFLPILRWATLSQRSFDSSREKRERGDGRFEDLCARQRRAFQRPFSGRPSAARSVSSRRCDEHVNYYRQGSLELQWR